MRYLIRFSYDGSEFYGYQKQPKKRTVEEELEKALYSINNHKKTKVYSSGRTDRGVHAYEQVGHFNIEVSITPFKLKCAFNSLLPEDIHVYDVLEVENDFNSRFDVEEKTYIYKVNIGEYNPIERKYVYQYNKDLDIDKMKKAIKDFEGEKDFKPFVSEECKKDDYTRIITKTSIERNDDIITFSFTGSGFMKYQVRNMVGTLIKIGAGKLEDNSIERILNGTLSKKVRFTAPAQGLYLTNVKHIVKK